MLPFRGILCNVSAGSNAAVLLKALMSHVKIPFFKLPASIQHPSRKQNYSGPPTSAQAIWVLSAGLLWWFWHTTFAVLKWCTVFSPLLSGIFHHLLEPWFCLHSPPASVNTDPEPPACRHCSKYSTTGTGAGSDCGPGPGSWSWSLAEEKIMMASLWSRRERNGGGRMYLTQRKEEQQSQ